MIVVGREVECIPKIPTTGSVSRKIGIGIKTPVYSFGHRNAQGLAWGEVNNVWRLHSCEHGDKSDDKMKRDRNPVILF